MKQIKTISVRDAAEFDKQVNAALAEGWTLKKRDVLPPYDCGSTYFYRKYYAELEKGEVLEKSCDNCKYERISAGAEPCLYCYYESKWEPKT